MAPVAEDDQMIDYSEATRSCSSREFSSELGDAAQEFFTGDYIDAPPAPGKRGGAFCSYTVPRATRT